MSLTQDPRPTQAELFAICDKMQAASNAFYADAIASRNHAFVEFTGLLNEYIKVCRRAAHKNVDFTMLNVHAGEHLTMERYEIAYVREKLECIYGEQLLEQ